jgi:hypothetical protein
LNTSIECYNIIVLCYRALNSGQWFQKLQELAQYKIKFVDCLIPYKCLGHESLALWVRRQRYQYKFREEGKKSNLTDERIRALEELDFVWSFHGARWEDRFEEIKAFIQEYGHCNVPKKRCQEPTVGNVGQNPKRPLLKQIVKREEGNHIDVRVYQ